MVQIASDIGRIGDSAMLTAGFWRWVRAPVLKGPSALLGGIAAVMLPTIVRAAVNGEVTGCEFTPYLPFVLLAAILLGWWQAGIVALASVAILGGLFVGQSAQSFETPCFVSGAGVFLASSAMIIAIVLVIRKAIAALDRRGANEALGGIVFSLEQGQVWASWYGQGPPVLLGSRRRVGEMMKDFLDHEELAQRLDRMPEEVSNLPRNP